MIHRLLKQQLKQFNLDMSTPPSLEQWQDFIQQIEQSYAAAEKLKYEQLVETANDIIFTATADGRFSYVNPPAVQLTGYSESELLEKHFWDLVRPDYHEKVRRFYANQVEEKQANTYFEFPAVFKDGKETWLGQNVQLVMKDDEVIALQAIARDITDRKQTESQLLLQDTALQAAANGIVITDKNGQIIWVNEAFTTLTQFESDEAVGEHTRFLKSGKQDPVFYKNLWQTISVGQVWQDEIVNRRKDGSLYAEEMTITPVRATGNEITHYIAIKKDVTERKESEAQIAKNQQSQEALNAIMQLSLADSSLDDLLEQALDIILATPWLSVQAKGSIFLTDPHSPTLVMNAQRDLGKPLLTKCARVPFGQCLCGQAAASGEIVFANCVDGRHEIEYDGMPEHGHFNVPIMLNDEVVGVLNLYIEAGHQYDQQEIAFLESIAKTLAGLIQRKRAEQQIEEALELRNRQIEINRALSAARTESEVINAVVHKAGYYPEAGVAIFMMEPNGKYLTIRARNTMQSGLQPMPIGSQISLTQMPALFSPDKSFVTGSVLKDNRAAKAMKQMAKNAGIVSWATFPITAGNDWMGALMVAGQEEDLFDEQKLAIYHSLAEQSAVALRATRLFDETQRSLERRSRQIRLSTHIAQEIAAASDLPHLYEQVVTLIKESFGYYHTQLLRYDPALDVMALVVGYGEVGEQMLTMHHSMPMGVGLIGTAAVTGRSILRSNTTDDPYWQANALLPNTKGEIVVPIKLGDEVLGVLDVQTDKPNALTEDDQLMLEGLCGQIAVAIESTRLQQEMADQLRELNTLQRYMSRDGWQSYRIAKSQINGFRYDQSGVRPMKEQELLLTNGSPTKRKNGKTAVKPTTAAKQPAKELIDRPLVIRGETIGALAVENNPQRPLSDEENEFLSAVAEQVAEALEAARLFEQTQNALTGQERLASELGTVAEVSTAASTILEVDNLLQTVVELVKMRFGLYHAHIYLVNEAGDRLVLRAGAGDVGQIMVLEGREIPFNAESLVARTARRRQGFIENDVRKIIDFMPHPLLPNTQSEMAIPLIVGSTLIGVLDLQSDKAGYFSEEAMQVQRTLASQIAVAVQNAAMYADQVETSSKLRQVDKLKSEFLASMSHELRTPLNSIIGFADVLLEGLDGDLNERMDQDVRLIRDSGAHLRDLIGDILDMSKIEAGRMELRLEEIDMRQIAQDTLATSNPLAQEKKLELKLNLADDVHTIEADRTRIRQVLWNIMGNAIKFTEKGSVTLLMEVQEKMLRVSIRDTGIGIKPEDIVTVFEQFRQVDGSLNRSVGGTGLGMPITKKLIELHGGEIGVDSVPGQGSTFWFTLPVQRP